MIKYDPARTWPNWAPGSWEYLKGILPKDALCFEWGGGQSTRWLADRAGFVVTVESDPKWLERIVGLTASCSNCQVIYAPKFMRRYVDAVRLFRPKVYLVDGFQRRPCLEEARSLWKPGDIVVLDDALDYTGTDDLTDGVFNKWEPFEPPCTPEVFSMEHPNIGELTKEGAPHPETKETWVMRIGT